MLIFDELKETSPALEIGSLPGEEEAENSGISLSNSSSTLPSGIEMISSDPDLYDFDIVLPKEEDVESSSIPSSSRTDLSPSALVQLNFVSTSSSSSSSSSSFSL